MSKFGRFQVPEPPSALLRFHHHDGVSQLREVDHEPKIAVLDQEDLLAQGIYVDQFIPGAQRVDALGSCAPNTTIEMLSNVLPAVEFAAAVGRLGQRFPSPQDAYTDTVAAERAAIGFYHGVTDLTGNPASEWPPTDCGSSGPYLYQYALKLGLISTEKIAVAGNAESIVSLMQSNSVMIGMPWLPGWMEPVGPDNFLDGDGSIETLREQIEQADEGPPEGHEISGSAIEKLTFDRLGRVDPFNTVIRIRNHWDSSWADHGSARFHLSTLVLLANAVDIRQFVA